MVSQLRPSTDRSAHTSQALHGTGGLGQCEQALIVVTLTFFPFSNEFQL